MTEAAITDENTLDLSITFLCDMYIINILIYILKGQSFKSNVMMK